MILALDAFSEDEVRQSGKLAMLIGPAGSGKSFTINAMEALLEELHGEGVLVHVALTGKAANNIHGATLRSCQQGCAITVGNTAEYIPLKQDVLRILQRYYRGKRAIVIDEFSMMKQRELYFLDRRLQEIMGNDLPFGGLLVILTGDNAQFPPVGGRSLWDDSLGRTGNDELGFIRYRQFLTNVVELERVERITANSELAERFRELLDRLRTGDCTDADFELLRERAQAYMTPEQWEQEFGEDSEVTRLYTTNREVAEENNRRIKLLDQPIALVRAEQTGIARSLSEEHFQNLPSKLYLCNGAVVMSIHNLCQQAGISNGSAGVVKEIVYDDGVSPPGLPKCVWVDFGAGYTGPSFFRPELVERRGWVPIQPVTVTIRTPCSSSPSGYVESSKRMLPLRLSWAWTIWKFQGQTVRSKLVVNLSNNERELGLTYVALSRLTDLRNLGIEGPFTRERIIDKIKNHAKMAGRIRETQRLRSIAAETKLRLDARRARLHAENN